MTCPNGVTRRITRTRRVIFCGACKNCPLRPRCTTRRDWVAREDLREAYRKHRPIVERSIAWLIGPKNRYRQLRYRGVSNNQWLQLRMTALNLRRMINIGLHPANGSWIIPDPA